MMTKEEYERNLIRMWDSLRNECKGEKNCGGVNCRDCPLGSGFCQACSHSVDVLNIYKTIEAVEKWAKENPIKTNAQKFKKVFGTEVLKDACVNGDKQCKECEYFNGDSCDVRNRFWYKEYKPTKEGEE